MAYCQGRADEAWRLCQASVEMCRSEDDKFTIGMPLQVLGRLAIHRGDFEQAENMLAEALTISREVNERRLVAITLGTLGRLERFRGRAAEALHHFRGNCSAFFAPPSPGGEPPG